MTRRLSQSQLLAITFRTAQARSAPPPRSPSFWDSALLTAAFVFGLAALVAWLLSSPASPAAPACAPAPPPMRLLCPDGRSVPGVYLDADGRLCLDGDRLLESTAGCVLLPAHPTPLSLRYQPGRLEARR